MNRKEFLKTAAAGLIAASVPSVALRAAARSPHKRPERRSGRLSLAFEPYDLKLIHPFTVAVNTRTHTPDVQVTLEYDGITGYGEASMPPYLGETQESVCRFLSSLDLSRFTDPFRMDEILDYVDRAAPRQPGGQGFGRSGAARSGRQAARTTVVQDMGSVARKGADTSFTIGIDTAEVVRQKVEETAPYNVIKVKMGVEGDRELVEVIRSATDKPLCVDANQGWTDKERALETICWLAERNTLFVEQPLPKEMIDETAWLRERSPLPIIADEFLQQPSGRQACRGSLRRHQYQADEKHRS